MKKLLLVLGILLISLSACGKTTYEKAVELTEEKLKDYTSKEENTYLYIYGEKTNEELRTINWLYEKDDVDYELSNDYLVLVDNNDGGEKSFFVTIHEYAGDFDEYYDYIYDEEVERYFCLVENVSLRSSNESVVEELCEELDGKMVE